MLAVAVISEDGTLRCSATGKEQSKVYKRLEKKKLSARWLLTKTKAKQRPSVLNFPDNA